MNGIIIMDKPPDWTSHDVVGKLRGLLGEKRIGHGGTLDPMATGVLPVFVGRATRAVQFCESADKEYIAGLRLGIETDTQDTTGKIISTRTCLADRSDVEKVLQQFVGEQEQLPPMYSAVKKGGHKLYEFARRGIEVEREPRKIIISRIELLDEMADGFLIRVICSKGTYIRTLCSDIGRRLGCGGAMSSLRRTRAGIFTLDNAVTIENVSAAAGLGNVQSLLSPVDSLFSAYPAFTVGTGQLQKCLNGTDFSVPGIGDGLYRVYGEDGAFLLLGKAENSVMRTVKSFFEV